MNFEHAIGLLRKEFRASFEAYVWFAGAITNTIEGTTARKEASAAYSHERHMCEELHRAIEALRSAEEREANPVEP